MYYNRTRAAEINAPIIVLEAALTMSSCLLLTCLLSAIAATGYGLSCIDCTSLSGTVCNGSSMVCPSGDYSCLLSYTVTSIGGMEISKLYIRQCAQNNLCSKTGSISLPNGKIKAGTTCCTSDDCLPPKPTLPPDSSEKNGRSCKACFAPNSKTCDTELFTDCVGNEMMCITQVSTTTGDVTSTTTVQGCSTKEMCQPARQMWNLNKMKVHLENTCLNNGVYVQPNLMLAAIALWLFWKSSC
ncbi:phospholipase A2 inhibitor gamma subunit B-like [Dendropsophus ebraccatus]|uniref:phospholipase A2 inhibitor gamma subunit B-like n=1 Tax=Dendropsophus ebraccatus TaxID=150705 RepID=UPI003831713E